VVAIKWSLPRRTSNRLNHHAGRHLTVPQAKSRSDLVVEQLSEVNRGLSKANRDLEYSKMGVDAYAFFRGTAHLFWSGFVGDRKRS